MALDLSDERIGDLKITHGFLNAVTAAYQGIYVHQSVLGQLLASAAAEDAQRDARQTLDDLGEWWRRFERHEPILRIADGDDLGADAARAWELLEQARKRFDRLSVALLESIDVDTIRGDHHLRAVRVAALCEHAYAREHYLRGLVRYGEVMQQDAVADRWRQHVLPAMEERAEATGYFEHWKDLEPEVCEAEAGRLLDLTLTLPVALGRLSIDILHLFGLYRGRFGYGEAGIPPEESDGWTRAGLQPYQAAQWRRAGMRPEQAAEWITGGVPDALAAAGFAWRGIPVEAAAPWYAAGYDARGAAEWMREGVQTPEQLPRSAQG